MHRVANLACLTATAGLAAAAATGCGKDVPPNAVAKVGDSVITKNEFNEWFENAASSQSQGGQAAVPDPPNYSRCVAQLREQPVPKGQQKPADSVLKTQCQQQYKQLKNDTMQFLIQAQWVQQEAEARDIEITDAEVRRSFEDQKKQAFPKEADYQKYLKTSGLNEDDILFRVKLDTLQTKLTQDVTEDASKVSETDVKEYYDKNKKRFAQPERRDLRVVLTKTEGKAKQAKAALDRGQGFKAVSKRFSIDEASKSQGGKLPDVAKGQQEKPLDKAVFAARKGRIEGPVKTQFGYYVFEVTKVKPASQQSFKESKENIRNLLRSQRQQKTLDAWIKDFREDYKDKTDCADDYVIDECSNAPKPKESTTPVPGGGQQPAPAPEGGAPAPQEGAPAPQTPTPAPQTPAPSPQDSGPAP